MGELLDDVGAVEFEQDLDFPADDFFVLDLVERNGLDRQQFVLVVLHVASIDGSEAAPAQLHWSDHVVLDHLAIHDYLKKDVINLDSSLL